MRILFLLALALAVAAPTGAQTASQDVVITAANISAISLDDAQVNIELNAPAVVGDSLSGTMSSSYAVTTNQALTKITGTLSADYTLGVVLYATLAAPSPGVSSGQQRLRGGTAVDLVTGLTPLSESGLSIDYEARGPATVPSTYGASRTVTYTVTAVVP